MQRKQMKKLEISDLRWPQSMPSGSISGWILQSTRQLWWDGRWKANLDLFELINREFKYFLHFLKNDYWFFISQDDVIKMNDYQLWPCLIPYWAFSMMGVAELWACRIDDSFPTDVPGQPIRYTGTGWGKINRKDSEENNERPHVRRSLLYHIDTSYDKV